MIECKYSCKLCGIKERKILVKEREPDMNVVDWLNSAAYLMGRDHDLESPFCYIESLSEVWIPMPPGTERIGGPVIT